MPRWVFRYVGNKTYDFSSKKKDFCPKTTKFGQKLAFLVNLGQAMQAYSMPCCWSVGGCGAWAVSRKTPIYFIYIFWLIQHFVSHNHHHHHLGYRCGCARALVWCIYRGDTIRQIGFWSHKGQVHIPVTIPPIKAVALLHFLITIETICQCKRPPSRLSFCF